MEGVAIEFPEELANSRPVSEGVELFLYEGLLSRKGVLATFPVGWWSRPVFG
jgi:hypothetical protein